MALKAEVLLSLIEETLAEPAVGTLRAEPGLAWFEPRLAAAAADLRAHLKGNAPDRAAAEARAGLVTLDAAHDGWHRFAWRLLDAFAHHPEPAVALPVAAAMAVLFPQGLAVNRAAYRQEVAAVEVLAERQARPDVQPGLAVLRAAGVDIDGALAGCVAAGRALGAGLRAAEAAEAEASARVRAAGLFEARAEASATFALFLRTVALVLAGAAPEVAARRSRLLLPARKARAALGRAGQGAAAGEVGALLSDAGLGAGDPGEGDLEAGGPSPG